MEVELISELLDKVDELERIANLTRRGSELVVYKTALDDVRSLLNLHPVPVSLNMVRRRKVAQTHGLSSRLRQ